ncbi:terpene synthase family protein [Streptomyces sp. NPDC059982]|uniref:terpene synthase family protein n=1 Tax=unclassified Streptomyces TaxID=2593676 RepID=UPI0036B23B33
MTSPAHPLQFGIPVLRHIHPEADRVGKSLDLWAAGIGLTDSPAERARMRAAGFHLIASRILHDASVEAVELFARWVLWLFHLDDQQDEGPMGRSADEVRSVYRALVRVIDGYPPAPAPVAAVAALSDLWSRTAAGLSEAWRLRFRSHLLGHRDAFLTQISHRDHATIPAPQEYPALRRNANGTFMFDLIEAALHTEVPAGLADSALWREMCAASNDLTAWCNDILSLTREKAAGETTNYVIVLEHATGCDTPTAIDQVCERIKARHHRLTALRTELDEPLAALPAPLRDTVTHTADAIGAMPGTQLAWLAESGRYPNTTTPG